MRYKPLCFHHVVQDFFKDLETWRQFFQQTKRAGRFEGEMLHGPHMDLMNKRLEAVSKGSARNEAQTEYLLCRFDVLGYIGAAEEKVASWTAKCGHLEEVEATLADFVVRTELDPFFSFFFFFRWGILELTTLQF